MGKPARLGNSLVPPDEAALIPGQEPVNVAPVESVKVQGRSRRPRGVPLDCSESVDRGRSRVGNQQLLESPVSCTPWHFPRLSPIPKQGSAIKDRKL